MRLHSARRHSRMVLCCLTLMLLPTSFALAGHTGRPHLIYAQGWYGQYGTWSTSGWNSRDFNRVFHQQGTLWSVYYIRTDDSIAGYELSSENPTVSNADIAYAKARCHNHNDMSGVMWTCETTN